MIVTINDGEMRSSYTASGTEVTYNGKTMTSLPVSGMEGYVACYEMTDFLSKVDATSQQLVFRPYFLTHDGACVFGTTIRGFRVPDPDIQRQLKVRDVKFGMDITPSRFHIVVAGSLPPKMAGVSRFLLLKSPAASAAPAESNDIQITAVDNGDTNVLALQKGDLTGMILPNGKADSLFAGWFLDYACTIPADFSDVSEDMTVYAKYIRGKDVKMDVRQQNVRKSGGAVTFNVSVKGLSADIREVIVNCSSESFSGAFALTNAARGASRKTANAEYTGTFAAEGFADGETLIITPCWLTPDGMTVAGNPQEYVFSAGKTAAPKQ